MTTCIRCGHTHTSQCGFRAYLPGQDVAYDEPGGHPCPCSHPMFAKPVALRSVFKADEPTIYGRVYPRAVLDRAVADLQPKVKARSLIGAIDPPGNPRCGPQPLADVSHVVTRLDLGDDYLEVEVEPLATPHGRVLVELLKTEKVVFNPKGMGTIGEDGVIGDDFRIVGFDVTIEKPETYRGAVMLNHRIEKALDVAMGFGSTDGAHHKTWVIDQMVRALTGDDYEDWVKEHNAGDDGGDTYAWDEGIAP